MQKLERRAVARYRVKLPVDVEMDGYTISEAISIEISLAGIRLACEGPVAGKLLNKYIQVTPGENITANIEIKLPNPSGVTQNLHCKARVVSVNRASQVRYNVGFKFLKFDDDSQQYWQDYISTLEK